MGFVEANNHHDSYSNVLRNSRQKLLLAIKIIVPGVVSIYLLGIGIRYSYNRIGR